MMRFVELSLEIAALPFGKVIRRAILREATFECAVVM